MSDHTLPLFWVLCDRVVAWQMHRMSVMKTQISKQMKIYNVLNQGEFLICIAYISFFVKSCLLSIMVFEFEGFLFVAFVSLMEEMVLQFLSVESRQ